MGCRFFQGAVPFADSLRRLWWLSFFPLLSLAPADSPAPRAALTGFSQVLTMSAAELKTQLTGGTSTVSGTTLRIPLAPTKKRGRPSP